MLSIFHSWTPLECQVVWGDSNGYLTQLLLLLEPVIKQYLSMNVIKYEKLVKEMSAKFVSMVAQNVR